MKCPRCRADILDSSRFCSNCAASLSSHEDEPPVSFTKTLEMPIAALKRETVIAGKYRIIEEIGRGGMGVFCKAEAVGLQRKG